MCFKSMYRKTSTFHIRICNNLIHTHLTGNSFHLLNFRVNTEQFTSPIYASYSSKASSYKDGHAHCSMYMLLFFSLHIYIYIFVYEKGKLFLDISGTYLYICSGKMGMAVFL